jgi:hypothetical protein
MTTIPEWLHHPKLRGVVSELNAAKDNYDAACKWMNSARTNLRETLRDSEVMCQCGKTYKLCEVDVIAEYPKGFFLGDEDRCARSWYFVCTECHDLCSLAETIGGFGVGLLTRAFFSYYVDGNNTTAVLDLLKLHQDKRRTEYAAEEKERALERARRLLRENGELP